MLAAVAVLSLATATAALAPSPRALAMERQFQAEHDAEVAQSEALIASGNVPLVFPSCTALNFPEFYPN